VTTLGASYQPLSALVAEQVRSRIVTGVLAPGTRLVEAALAAELGVSRIPVREALHQLADEGFVRSTPRRGAVVAELSGDDARELYEVRAVLEGLAARLAAVHRGAADLEALGEVMARGRSAVERRAWPELAQLNSLFHERLAAASGNGHLAALARGYGEKLSWAFSASAPGRAPAAWREHGGILAAVRAGDVERAELRAAGHVDRSRRVFLGRRSLRATGGP